MPPQQPNPFRAQALAWSIAMNFVFSVAAGALLGWFIDWLLGSSPWIMLVGLIAGLIGGFYRFIREASAASKATSPPRTPPQTQAPASPTPDADQKPDPHEETSPH